jgi:ABC-type sugar transport system ATPase subunit
MSLLELERVSKAYGPLGEHVALRDVSLRLDAGEAVVVWGMRRSGRTTLLRVAAGIVTPDHGAVRFEGRDLRTSKDEWLGEGIGYCRRTFAPSEGKRVIDQLVGGLLGRGISIERAAARARAALERTEAEECSTLRTGELDSAELVRVAIARAIAFQPRLLLIDEPTLGVDLLARDGILRLLHSFTREGIAILASTGESPGLSGARALTLSEGELHGSQSGELARVLELRRSV